MNPKTLKTRRIHFSQLILGIAVILLVVFATYYFMVHLPKIRAVEHQRELERIEAQKQKELEVIEARDRAQEEEARQEQYEKYRKECSELKTQKLEKYEDFINTCTGIGGNSIDYCLNSPAGKAFEQSLNKDFIENCINAKKNLWY